jgi:hypothetical protein
MESRPFGKAFSPRRQSTLKFVWNEKLLVVRVSSSHYKFDALYYLLLLMDIAIRPSSWWLCVLGEAFLILLHWLYILPTCGAKLDNDEQVPRTL